MGMGEKTSMDERGRITIPSKIRETIGKKEFTIRLIDKQTIILEAINQENLLNEIKTIKLRGDPARAATDFSRVKDKYGATKK